MRVDKSSVIMETSFQSLPSRMFASLSWGKGVHQEVTFKKSSKVSVTHKVCLIRHTHVLFSFQNTSYCLTPPHTFLGGGGGEMQALTLHLNFGDRS